MKYCPNCGVAVQPGAVECFQCHTHFAAVRDAVEHPAAPTSQGGSGRVTDLSPRELRKEIRWGVFQGILLAAAIVLVVYLVVILLIAGVINAAV